MLIERVVSVAHANYRGLSLLDERFAIGQAAMEEFSLSVKRQGMKSDTWFSRKIRLLTNFVHFNERLSRAETVPTSWHGNWQ